MYRNENERNFIKKETKANMQLLVGEKYEDSVKYDEIIEDFLNDKKPSIVVKSRVTGCTSLLVSYLIELMDCGENIWYFCNYVNGCKHAMEKIARIVSQYHSFSPIVTFSNLSVKSVISNGTITFISTNSKFDEKLVGREAPDVVVYDEMAFFKSESVNNLLNFISIIGGARKKIKEICVSTLSPKGSVFNFIAEIFNHIKINWTDFPNRFGKGTRLERIVNNVKLSIKIDEENISDVLTNKEFINTMSKEGWELTSDWREEMKKLNGYLFEYVRTEIDAETELEYAERNNMIDDEEEDLNILVDILDEDKINDFLANDFIYDDNDIWVKNQCECNDMCSDWCEIK